MAADERVLAAWLSGSFAAGTADAYSHIDLHCAVTDESADWFAGHWHELAARITPLVHAGSIPGVLGGVVITPEWLHLDLVFHPRSRCDPAILTSVQPLFDRTGALLPGERVPADDQPGDPATWPWCSAAASCCLPPTAPSCAATRAWSRSCWPRTACRKRDGNKRLNPYLTAGQRAFLESLPPLSATRDSVIRFDQIMAADLITRGRALAARTGASWPSEFERATTAYLERCLNVPFGPG